MTKSDRTKYCLLFDSDGTLVDSEAINTEALADELALHEIKEDPLALLDRYRGWQFKALLSDLGVRHGISLDRQFEISFRARASTYFDSKLRAVENIHGALQQLDDAKCVASNAPMNKLTQVLDKTDLRAFFSDCLFSAYVIDIFKPDPGLFLHAAEQMGFAAGQCIVIEDSVVGVQAAIAAEMKCVWYCPEASGHPDLSSDHDPQRVLRISNMIELPSAISTLKAI